LLASERHFNFKVAAAVNPQSNLVIDDRDGGTEGRSKAFTARSPP
jgi:hypothetical protein